MYYLDHTTNSVFSLHYHLIVVVKYRRKVFRSQTMIDYAKTLVEEVANGFGVTVVEQGIDQDHIHILFRSKPTLDMTKFINSLKTNTSRMLRKNFKHEFSEILWGDSFWSPSYFLATTGNVTIDIIKKYVENQSVRKIKHG